MQPSETENRISRRALLRTIATATGAVTISACTPLRAILHLYPDEFQRDNDKVDNVLAALVITVVPGMPLADANLTRVFYDRYYPLARFRRFLASDLCARAHARFGTDGFEFLTPQQRTEVVQDGLDQGGTTRRLYTGAVFLTQLACYGGIYDDTRGCPLIDYPGTFDGGEISHPDPRQFMATTLTTDGNPA